MQVWSENVMDLRMSCLHLSESQRILRSILAPPKEETDKQWDDLQAGGESQHCVGGGMEVFVLKKRYLRWDIISFLWIVEVCPSKPTLSLWLPSRARLGVCNSQAGKFQHNIKVSSAYIQSCGGRVKLSGSCQEDGGSHIGRIPALAYRAEDERDDLPPEVPFHSGMAKWGESVTLTELLFFIIITYLCFHHSSYHLIFLYI